MTREQAEKLRQEKRRKRLRKKRIKAFSLLALFIVLAAAIVFFAVKGIAHLKADSETEPNDNPIGTAGVIENENSEENSGDVVVDEGIADENTADEGNSDENTTDEGETADVPSAESTAVPNEEPANSEQQTSTTPVGTKPEQSWSTMLVNKWSYMPEGYVPDVRPINFENVGLNDKFDVRAADALEQMLADARAAGYNMYLVSAYRSHDYQVNLFNRKVNEYKALGYDDATAYEQASQWVAIPGTSEHCTGLAADIVSSTWYNHNSDLTHDFENTEHFDWLYSHCADYGFILRYPKGAEGITGITYEPWHYRFVGVDAAKYIMENHITLEEFWA